MDSLWTREAYGQAPGPTEFFCCRVTMSLWFTDLAFHSQRTQTPWWYFVWGRIKDRLRVPSIWNLKPSEGRASQLHKMLSLLWWLYWGVLWASAKPLAKTSPQMDLPTGALCPGYQPDSGSPGTGLLLGDPGCPFPSDSSQSVRDTLSCCILEREEVRGDISFFPRWHLGPCSNLLTFLQVTALHNKGYERQLFRTHMSLMWHN